MSIHIYRDPKSKKNYMENVNFPELNLFCFSNIKTGWMKLN